MTAPTNATERLAAWDDRVRWTIILAATLPLGLAILPIGPESTAAVIIDLASWAVFVVDLAVHLYYKRNYLRTGSGLFDLSIIVFTFPWYILPGVDGTQFLAVFRLARVLRIISVTGAGPRLKYLYNQLGTLLIATAVGVIAAALIVIQAEPPESGFDTFGDAMWWGIVTLLTVGYGDYYPVTSAGRFAGFMVMLLGIAVLGTLAGVLASMFGGAADTPDENAATLETITKRIQDIDGRLGAVEEHLAAIRHALDDGDSRPHR